MQAGIAAVSMMVDSATLDRLCQAQTDMCTTHTDSARLFFRVLQASAQCCVEMQQRYAAGAAQAAQLTRCQLDAMPALEVSSSSCALPDVPT